MIQFPVFVCHYSKAGYAGGGRWGGEDMIMMTFRPHSNSIKWANTFTNDGAQLILSLDSSWMLRSWVLTRFLTYSHISSSSPHLTGMFTYIKTPMPPLLSYIHNILSLMILNHVRHCWLLMQALTDLLVLYLPTPRQLQQHTADVMKVAFHTPGWHCITSMLLLLSGTVFHHFFSLFCTTHDNEFQQLKINT